MSNINNLHPTEANILKALDDGIWHSSQELYLAGGGIRYSERIKTLIDKKGYSIIKKYPSKLTKEDRQIPMKGGEYPKNGKVYRLIK
jgi:hypothetical protein